MNRDAIRAIAASAALRLQLFVAARNQVFPRQSASPRTLSLARFVLKVFSGYEAKSLGLRGEPDLPVELHRVIGLQINVLARDGVNQHLHHRRRNASPAMSAVCPHVDDIGVAYAVRELSRTSNHTPAVPDHDVPVCDARLRIEPADNCLLDFSRLAIFAYGAATAGAPNLRHGA